MGQQTDETRALRAAILRALEAEPDGLHRAGICRAIQAEPGEHRLVNGVISGLIRAGLCLAVGGMVRITPAGRKSLAPVAPVAAPLPPAPAPSNAAVTVRVDASREYALEALTLIEMAIPGPNPPPTTVDAIVDRAVTALHSIHNLRRIERLYNDDRAAKERAEAEAADLKGRLDVSTMEVARLTAERVLDDQRAKMVPPAWETEALRGNLDDAKAEIARLRAQLAEAQRSRISWDIGETRRLVRQRITHETLAEVTIDGDDVVWRATDDHAHGVIAIPKPGEDDAAVEQALVMGQMLAEVACGARVVLAAKDGGAL